MDNYCTIVSALFQGFLGERTLKNRLTLFPNGNILAFTYSHNYHKLEYRAKYHKIEGKGDFYVIFTFLFTFSHTSNIKRQTPETILFILPPSIL